MSTPSSHANSHQPPPLVFQPAKQDTPTLNSLLQKPVVVSSSSTPNPYSAPTPPFGASGASATPPATDSGAASGEQRWPHFVGRFHGPIDVHKVSKMSIYILYAMLA